MKKIICALTALCTAGALCACNAKPQDTESGWDLGSMPAVTAPDIQIPSMTMPDITVEKPDLDLPDLTVPTYGADAPADETQGDAAQASGSISDESGFVYSGELQQIGDDEHGYIQVPADFVKFQDVDVEGLVQMSDKTGKNIITITHYKDIDYEKLANSMRYSLESDSRAEKVTGAVASPNSYDAYQVYCTYPADQTFLVAWSIKDPADPGSAYYLSMEFDSAHQDIMACSSTFRTKEDYHRENTGSGA